MPSIPKKSKFFRVSMGAVIASLLWLVITLYKPPTRLAAAGQVPAATSTNLASNLAVGNNHCTYLPLVIAAPTSTGSPPAGAYPLHASANGRYLVDANNVPFLITGDSPQALIGNLSESEAATYLADRQAHGFNSVWINLVCGSYTGCRNDGSTYDGILPFTTPGDLSTPNEAYFARADHMIQLAAQYGLVVFLDPLETGAWLGLMQANGVSKTYNYGVYLGQRYKNFLNIVWFNGNDFANNRFPADNALVLALADGIRSVDTNHLHTVEFMFTSTSLDNPAWVSRVGLNGAYTYSSTYFSVLRAYNQGVVPAFHIEGNYDLATTNGGAPNNTTPNMLRRQEYWTLTSGGAGYLYGNAYLWPMLAGWQSHLNTQGVVEIGYVNALFKNRAWYNLVPDQTHVVLTAGYGTYEDVDTTASDYATAASTPDGRLVIIYLPTARTMTVDMSKLAGPVTARWYDPTNGTYTTISGSPFPNAGSLQFTPPASNSAGDSDWVLVLEAQPAP